MALLLAKNIYKSFGRRKVLTDVNFSLEKGEFASIVGLSGSGKSTLFSIISGLETPDSGKVLLNGSDISGKTGNVSFMPQKDLLFPYYTVLDNVILPLLIKGQKKADARKKAGTFFKEFGLEGTQEMYPSELSGGMRQRAALLRTYLSSKDLMLLDEPFSALDMLTKNKMHEWYLKTIEKLHLTTLLITHDIEEAILLSDRIFILENAKDDLKTNLVREIKVLEPHPRSMEFSFTENFIKLKKEIFTLLG